MNLDDFEDYIDKTILARGCDYYEYGHVASLKKIDDNIYEAKVYGSDTYTVEVELDNDGNIIDTQCDCPYDMGEYCKHQVAVFFALRNDNVSEKDKKSDQEIKFEFVRQKTPDIEELLNNRTKAELVEFLLNIASEYDEIRQRIELDFSSEGEKEEIAKATEIIRTFIRKNSDRHGFVAYEDADEAVRGTDLVLEKAHMAFAQGKSLHAVKLALCVIHEMIDLLQEADDSDGVIGEVIDESFGLISEITEDEGLSSENKENIFNELIDESGDRRYDGWDDWRIDLFEGCSMLAGNTHLRTELENYLTSQINNKKGDSWSTKYISERANLIRYNMIEKYDGEKKAREFIVQNLQYSGFREMAIEAAMKKKEYDKVITLTLDGEEKDKNWPGLINKWSKYRYEAFKLSGRLESQRELAKNFVLDGNTEYYDELKKTYSAEEWPAVYRKILSSLETQKKTYMGIYRYILIQEGEKQKLLDYVKGTPRLIESFYEYLIPEFREEVYTVFMKYIEDTASGANKRKDYQRVCAIIRKLKKLGGKEQALKIKQKLLIGYVNRPAFMDELSRV